MNSDPPGAVFGRRGRGSRDPVVLPARISKPVRIGRPFVNLVGLTCLALVVAGVILWAFPGIEALKAETARAQENVIKIVNQPITHLPRSGPVTLYSPGWFHEGATVPDFNNVDIRATQERPYEDHVTSDLNPNEMFIGSELEFNAMTKYFYADRTLPKKRLSDTEMVEINSLYRVIGHDEQAILMRWLSMIGAVVGAVGSALFLLNRRHGTSHSPGLAA